MKEAFEKIKAAWEENPVAVIAITSGSFIALAKLLDATTAARNARTWKKEVDRRYRYSTRR